MKFVVLVLLGVLALIRCEEKSEVVVLTDANFEKFLSDSKKPVFLKLYAPWCGHCKKMAPEYVKVAKMAKEQGKDYVFAEIDCSVHTKAKTFFNASGFPTLILYNNNVKESYSGERTAEGILSFLNKKFSTGAVELNTKEEIEKVKNSNTLSVIHLCLLIQ